MSILKFEELFNKSQLGSSNYENKESEVFIKYLLEKKNTRQMYDLFCKESIIVGLEELGLLKVSFAMIGSTLKFNNKKIVENYNPFDSIIDKLSFASKFINPIQITDQGTPQRERINELVRKLERANKQNLQEEIHTQKWHIPENLFPYIKSYGYNVFMNSQEEPNQQLLSVNYLDLTIDDSLNKVNMGATCIEEMSTIENISITIENCAQLTGNEYTYLERALASLDLLKLELSFKKATTLYDEQIECLMSALALLSQLRELKIAICLSYITDKGVKYLEEAIRNLSELKEIHIVFEFCPNITDDAISSLAFIIAESLGLRKVVLALRSCGKLSFQGLKNIRDLFRNYHSIKSLDIRMDPIYMETSYLYTLDDTLE